MSEINDGDINRQISKEGVDIERQVEVNKITSKNVKNIVTGLTNPEHSKGQSRAIFEEKMKLKDGREVSLKVLYKDLGEKEEREEQERKDMEERIEGFSIAIQEVREKEAKEEKRIAEEKAIKERQRIIDDLGLRNLPDRHAK